jgi:hypothetical protein
MRAVILAFGLFLPGMVSAETPMTLAEFESYVTGKTLSYSQYGEAFGVEEYLSGRRVRWAFTEDVCQYGTYFEQDGQICFSYENDPVSHCWTFWQEGSGLKALSVSDAPGAELSEVAQTQQPLACAGPEVGV